MCHQGKPLLHALVKYKSLTNSRGSKPNFVWKILSMWKWVSPVPICGAWPPTPEVACPGKAAGLLPFSELCRSRWRGGLSPPAVIGNPWAPRDLEMSVGALAHMSVQTIRCLIAGRKLEELVSICLCYPCDCFMKAAPVRSQIAAAKIMSWLWEAGPWSTARFGSPVHSLRWDNTSTATLATEIHGKNYPRLQ